MTDYGRINVTKRDALLTLFSDLEWHPHHELAEVGGVRYSARILELKRLGYIVETADGDEGRSYRMSSMMRGEPLGKRVKVYLEERAVRSILDGHMPRAARSALEEALGSFEANREKL